MTNDYRLMTTKSHRRAGFGLLEVILAVGIVILVVAAVVGLSQFVLRGYVTVGSRTTAYQLAQQGVEIARAVRDTGTLDTKPGTDWQTGLQISGASYRQNFAVSCAQGTVCPWQLSGGTETLTIDGISFTRSIFVEDAGLSDSTENANTRKVRVRVNWSEGIRQQSVEVTTFFTNWRLES